MLFSICMIAFVGCTPSEPVYEASQPTTDAEVRIDTHDFLRDFPALSESGLVHVVIEIPAGTLAKWEVDKETGHLVWESVGDSLRVVRFLPYPANYGMIPRTYLPIDQGGDGDPLDVFVIGPALARGRVVPVRVIGVVRMLDRGEQDDKLLAVDTESVFGDIHTLAQLRQEFPGADQLLLGWLAAYKKPGLVEIQDISDEIVAQRILEASIQAFEAQ